jgi:ubiquinone/menaquinone biosynthesis C-methylase UbiE
MTIDPNRKIFENPSIGAEYGRMSDLQAPEAAMLDKFRHEIAGSHVLDLGVGAGRTTPYLLELTKNYVGADYSGDMIERCRRRFPGVRFEEIDARDLSAFGDASFDLVLFSFNGIDCVDHRDRLTVMREIRRVLKDGGLFIFSTHNRNGVVRKAWSLDHFDINPLRHPARFARRIASYLLGIANHFKSAGRTEIRDEYCIINDAAHTHSLMLYYIHIDAQKAQLRREQFHQIEVIGLDGQWLSDEECKTNRDNWIYYVARR